MNCKINDIGCTMPEYPKNEELIREIMDNVTCQLERTMNGVFKLAEILSPSILSSDCVSEKVPVEDGLYSDIINKFRDIDNDLRQIEIIVNKLL